MAAGRAPVCVGNCQRAVLARLRRMGEEDFRPYDGGGEGLYHRFYAAVQSVLRERLERIDRLRRLHRRRRGGKAPGGQQDQPRR